MRKTLILLFALAIPAQAETRIFVYTETSAEGFVDSPRAQDSVKDLKDVVSKRKGLVLVDKRDDADILLEVMNSANVVSGTQAKTETRRGIFGGIDSTTTATDTTLPSLTVMLRVPDADYSKELSVTAQRFWKDLAKLIVDQAQQWLKLNGAQLKRVIDSK